MFDGEGWNKLVDAAGTTKDVRWDSVWAATFNGAGVRTRTDFGYQGLNPANSATGIQKAMFGFGASAIKTELAGATLNFAWFYFNVAASGPSNGSIFNFGTHNRVSSPTSFSRVKRDIVSSEQVPPKTGEYYMPVPKSIAKGFQDGTVTGITIEAPDDSFIYHGALRSVSLRVNYTKP